MNMADEYKWDGSKPRREPQPMTVRAGEKFWVYDPETGKALTAIIGYAEDRDNFAIYGGWEVVNEQAATAYAAKHAEADRRLAESLNRLEQWQVQWNRFEKQLFESTEADPPPVPAQVCACCAGTRTVKSLFLGVDMPCPECKEGG